MLKVWQSLHFLYTWLAQVQEWTSTSEHRRLIIKEENAKCITTSNCLRYNNFKINKENLQVSMYSWQVIPFNSFRKPLIGKNIYYNRLKFRQRNQLQKAQTWWREKKLKLPTWLHKRITYINYPNRKKFLNYKVCLTSV